MANNKHREMWKNLHLIGKICMQVGKFEFVIKCFSSAIKGMENAIEIYDLPIKLYSCKRPKYRGRVSPELKLIQHGRARVLCSLVALALPSPEPKESAPVGRATYGISGPPGQPLILK